MGKQFFSFLALALLALGLAACESADSQPSNVLKPNDPTTAMSGHTVGEMAEPGRRSSPARTVE